MTLGALLRLWGSTQRAILANTGSLLGTTAVSAVLGYAYWWLAARAFSSTAVGFAAAVIPAMTLLGTVGVLGLGTLLIAELPRRPGRELSLIATAMVVAGLGAGVLGLAFAIAWPLISPRFGPLAAGPEPMALFAVGVSLTAMTIVLDQGLIGLLRGELQLARNAIFSGAKLAALFLVAFSFPTVDWWMICVTWVLGNLLSLAPLVRLARPGGRRMGGYRPEWGLLRGLGRAAVAHHALNVALQFPHLALPVLVTTLLSAATNAYFYVAWMIASLGFVIPGALTTVLYAVGVRELHAIKSNTRFTLVVGLLGGVVANAVLLGGGDFLLSLFGGEYPEQAGQTLRILGLGVFPLIVKDHYAAICRIQGEPGRAASLTTVGGILELAMAAYGAYLGGLPGLAIGWVAGQIIEAALMAPLVYRIAARQEGSATPGPETGAARPSSAASAVVRVPKQRLLRSR